MGYYARWQQQMPDRKIKEAIPFEMASFVI
ncbi:MAG: hypothetical protein JWR02_2788 [Mucilaginibacter sp.]|nr:hypothetical protein [Mucilaginibacter sp.]